MPYIAIKSLPKDEEIKRKTVQRLHEVMVECWNCPPDAITISIEEFSMEEYAEKVIKPEIEPKMDKMYIVKGEKTF